MYLSRLPKKNANSASGTLCYLFVGEKARNTEANFFFIFFSVCSCVCVCVFSLLSLNGFSSPPAYLVFLHPCVGDVQKTFIY